VERGGSFPLSFVLDRIDNPDMVKMNSRIMSADGQPDSFGRAEIRIDETFHAVCGDAKNMDKLSAFVCREAG